MLNLVVVEGFLVRDVEVHETPYGKKAATFVISCMRDGYGKGVDFVKCKAFGGYAEALAKYKKKGDRIAVVGSLRYEKYDDYMRREIRELIVRVDKLQFQARDEKRTKKDKEIQDEFDD